MNEEWELVVGNRSFTGVNVDPNDFSDQAFAEARETGQQRRVSYRVRDQDVPEIEKLQGQEGLIVDSRGNANLRVKVLGAERKKLPRLSLVHLELILLTQVQ